MSDQSQFILELRQVYFAHEKNLYEFHKKFFDDYHTLISSINKRTSAKKLVKIEPDVLYDKDLFFTIQCVKTNIDVCIIETETGNIEFPAGSFYQGAIYPINILRIIESGGAEFIGYVS